MKKGLAPSIAALVGSLALFLGLSLYQIDLPGLYYDEATDAIPAMQLLLGQEVELFRGVGLHLLGHDLPLMVMDYVGAVNTYALMPFFALLGVNVFSLRLMTILGGALTIILAFFFAKELFDPKAAIVASLLLAVHPSFIFWTRQGIYVTSLLSVFAVGSLLLLLRWHQGKGSAYLLAAAFLLGLGLSAKLLFLWFIVAIAFMYVFFTLLGKRPGAGGPWWEMPLSIVPFLMGAGMILSYNLKSLGTVEILQKNLARTDYGVENAAFFPNLLTRLDSFRTMLDGGYFWFFGELFSASLYLPLFLASIAAILIFLLRRTIQWRGPALLLGLFSLVLLQGSFTVSGIWSTHLYMLLPFVAVVIGLAVSCAFRAAARWRAAALLGVGMVLALLGQSLYVDLRYHQTLTSTGGRRAHSDAIYRLASFLDGRGIAQPLAMDWGIKASVQVLTQGRVNPLEIFGYTQEPGQPSLDAVHKSLERPDNLYVFHAKDSTVFPRYEAFDNLVRKLEKKAALEGEIAERDGTVVYQVYSAR